MGQFGGVRCSKERSSPVGQSLVCLSPTRITATAQVIAIAASDPMAAELNDVADVEAKMPGVISGVREWFRWYKTPDGKPLNAFGFDEECLPAAKAVEVSTPPPAVADSMMDRRLKRCPTALTRCDLTCATFRLLRHLLY